MLAAWKVPATPRASVPTQSRGTFRSAKRKSTSTRSSCLAWRGRPLSRRRSDSRSGTSDLIVGSRGVTDLLTDVCLYDCFPGGKSPISRYQAVAAPVMETQEALVIEAMARLPPVSLYRIQRRKPGIGVEMHDLLTNEDVFVMDRGLGETAKVGLCLAARLIRFPDFGISMTSGASMVVEAILAQDLVDDIHAELGRGAQACLARMGAQDRSRYSICMLRDILVELSFGDLVSEVGAKDVE